MADNRKKFLGPNAGTLRDPTSNSLTHGRMRNPPRYMEMGGFSSAKKGFFKNDKKLTSPGDVS
jgi:hypothetical protein